jgi:hypothetical protein
MKMPDNMFPDTMTDEEFKVMWASVVETSANPTTCRTCGKKYTYGYQLYNHQARQGHE